MKLYKFLFFILAVLFYNDISAQGKVSVTINNFKNSKGVCQVCLFDNADAFKGSGGQPVACKKIKVEDKKVNLAFESVQPGTYAIMVFHDANSNNKMDTNFLGIPSEGYGASKNNLPFAAAPTFNGNKFHVASNNTIHIAIKLRNL